jgi:hypothetical protein
MGVALNIVLSEFIGLPRLIIDLDNGEQKRTQKR